VADVWSIQNVILSVVPNPPSTLTFTHSGSSGPKNVAFPLGTNLFGGTSFSSGGLVFNSGSITLNTAWVYGNGFSYGGGSGQTLQWANTTNPNAGSPDTGFSRISAGIIGVGTGAAASVAGTLYCARIDSSSADMQGSVSSAPSGITATNVVVAVGAATATFTVTSTEGFTVGDTVTLSAGGWTAGSGLASSTATVTTVTSTTSMVLTRASGGPWVAGTYSAQTGTLTQTGGTSVSVVFATAYTSTPTVVVTPTSNAGAFYLSAVSTSGFTVTYATSGTKTFNYIVMGNPT